MTVKNNALSVGEQVRREEDRLEKDDSGAKAAKKELLKIPVIIAGAAVYALGFNFFLQPLHLYAAGMMGFSQLIRYGLINLNIDIGNFDITGIIYYILNLPAMIVAFKHMRKRFLIKTVIAISSITLLLIIIPKPAVPILESTLGNAIIAGIICGTGIGIILLMGACDGGIDLIGILLINKNGKTSVGRVGLAVNAVLYGSMLFLFDIPTVIYSIIYSVFDSIAIDRLHAQNISSQVTVLTKLEDTRDMEIEVMGRLNRGMTRVDANGLFTGEPVKMFIIFINKRESGRLRGIIRAHDPNAFIVENENVRIEGNFLRKLE